MERPLIYYSSKNLEQILKGGDTCISKIEIFRDFIKTMHKNDFFYHELRKKP